MTMLRGREIRLARHVERLPGCGSVTAVDDDALGFLGSMMISVAGDRRITT
jgi:hypothetical protein